MSRALASIAAAVLAWAGFANRACATWSDVWDVGADMRDAMDVAVFATNVTVVITNAYGEVGTNTYANDINQFQNFDFQALPSFTGYVGLLYATNISIQPRERFGFDSLLAHYERYKVFSGVAATNDSDSGIMHYTDSESDDLGLSRHLFRVNFPSDTELTEATTGYAYNQLVSIKAALAADVQEYLMLTNAYTAGQYDGFGAASAVSNWSTVTICAHLGIPTNYFYWTPQRQLDGRGIATSRVATNWSTLYNPAISNGVVHTQMVYGVWTNINVTGTNGQRIAVVTTNEQILPGFTDMDYTWPSVKLIYAKLKAKKYTSPTYAFSFTNFTGTGFSVTLCPTNASLSSAQSAAITAQTNSVVENGFTRSTSEELSVDVCSTSGPSCHISSYSASYQYTDTITYQPPTCPTNMPEVEVMFDYYARPTTILGGYDPSGAADGGLEYGTNQWSHIASVTVALNTQPSSRRSVKTLSTTPPWSPSGWDSAWSCTNAPSSSYGWSGLDVMVVVNCNDLDFD